MRNGIAATVVALACIAATGAQAALSSDKLYSMIAPSVWRVISYDANGAAFAQGSAVVIAPETLLTNCHVLAKAKSFAVRQDNVVIAGTLQYIDVERDMCQIVARNLKAPAVRIGDSDKVVVGQKIYALGNPLGLELTLSDGLVSALRKDSNQRLQYIQISAPISPGSSGGGLFDDAGRLVGITTAVMQNGQNLNLAIPIKWLRELAGRSRAALGQTGGDARPAAPPPADSASTPEAKTPPPPAGFTRAVPPVPSGYAAIDDIDTLLAINPHARKGYEEFLTRRFPRAFVVAGDQGWRSAWTAKPAIAGEDPDPAVRAMARCEARYERKCVLYAVDGVVVYPKSGK